MSRQDRDRRKLRRRMRLVFLLIFGIASVLGYILLAITINGQPRGEPFPGWLAVFQPVTEPLADKVTLRVMPTNGNGRLLQSPGEDGNGGLFQSPGEVSYTVNVCGPDPYYGVLILGGKAKLIDPFSLPATVYVRDLTVAADTTTFSYASVPLGPVQLIPIKLPKVAPCTAQRVPMPLYTYVSAGVVGRPSTPIQQTWSAPAGLWHGPRTIQTLPLVGTLPGISPTNQPTFGFGVSGSLSLPPAFTVPKDLANQWKEPRLSKVLADQWRLPSQQNLQVRSTAIPPSSTIDATPPPSSYSISPWGIAWSSPDPMYPMARIIDNVSMSRLQQGLVFAAVGLGIGGSMLASLAFDRLQPPQNDHAAAGTSRDVEYSMLQTTPFQQPPRKKRTRRYASILRTVLITAIVIHQARHRQMH